MDENFRSTVAVALDGTGPAIVSGVVDGYAQSNAVTVQRRVITSASRRTPHRTLADSAAVLNAYTVRHDWDLTSDLTNLYRVLEGTGDAGRGQSIAGGYRWRVGAGADPVRFDLTLQHVDGSHYEARRCIFTDWTLTAERRSSIVCQTTLAAREFTGQDSAGTFAALPSIGRGACCNDIAALLNNDSSFPVFSVVVGFQRMANAGGFSEAGVAEAWTGSLAVDIAGRLVCRTPLETFASAWAAQMKCPLKLTINIPGGAILTVLMPVCVLQVASRTHIDDNLFEYVVDFAAIQDGDTEAAVLDLTA